MEGSKNRGGMSVYLYFFKEWYTRVLMSKSKGEKGQRYLFDFFFGSSVIRCVYHSM